VTSRDDKTQDFSIHWQDSVIAFPGNKRYVLIRFNSSPRFLDTSSADSSVLLQLKPELFMRKLYSL
jgi:hypothetical protein